MDNFKSKITRMVSKVKHYDLDVLVVEVARGFSKFVQAKLAEEGRILSGPEQDRILKAREDVLNAEGLMELDGALWNFEQAVRDIINPKPGEFEFAIAKYLQSAFNKMEELLDEFIKEHADDWKSRGIEVEPREKKEGKILPWKPEGGKH